ncbi:hypothetical protein BH24ACT22_BH24ACT22_14250 [soil metagenome]
MSVIERVKSGQPIEDARVELKAEWPEAEKAPRRIAGHANAARGASILWLIGVDEKKSLVGARANELATWFPKVKSHFDGLAPELVDLNVPVDGKTVVALHFETERAPFVVKNATFGQRGGGSVELEVPWRDGTSVRSARRSEMARMLSPLASSPEVEVLAAFLKTSPKQTSEGQRMSWQLGCLLYLTTQPGIHTIVPDHRYSVSMQEVKKASDNTGLNETVFEWKAVNSPQNTAARPQLGYDCNPLLLGDKMATEELRLRESGEITLRAMCDTETFDLSTVEEIAIIAELRPLNTEVPVAARALLSKMDRGTMNTNTSWIYESNPRMVELW